MPPVPFDAALRQQARDRLRLLEHRGQPREGLRRAAVAVAVVPHGDQAALVLCRRGRVGSHRGQYGLPGGRVDAGEQPIDAAVRELEEEVDVRPAEVLGLLDDYVTRSGFHISPVVVWCPDAQPRIASPVEITKIHLVPLSELHRSPRWITIPESDRRVLQVPVGEALIHAPTAAFLLQFAEVVLHGRHTRVADVEEPVFAWR